MSSKKLVVVTCPKCGREYLPSEIFVPNHFFGRPGIIQRDHAQHVVTFTGTSLDNNETYCCDSCDTIFNIRAKVSFESYVEDSLDFDTEYERKISYGISLKES